MSEIEIYAREDPTEIWQTPYVNGAGNAYLIPRDDDKLVYEFDKVSLWVFFLFKPNKLIVHKAI